MIHPSILAHMLSGAFMLVALFCLVTCYPKLRKLGLYEGLVLTLLFSIAIGLHGVSHLGLEKQYGYNPAYFIGF
jgi:membrane-associated PAP2 superfamily phosphatase